MFFWTVMAGFTVHHRVYTYQWEGRTIMLFPHLLAIFPVGSIMTQIAARTQFTFMNVYMAIITVAADLGKNQGFMTFPARQQFMSTLERKTSRFMFKGYFFQIY